LRHELEQFVSILDILWIEPEMSECMVKGVAGRALVSARVSGVLILAAYGHTAFHREEGRAGSISAV
jgi:hypothetical protein